MAGRSVGGNVGANVGANVGKSLSSETWRTHRHTLGVGQFEAHRTFAEPARRPMITRAAGPEGRNAS